MKKKTKVYPKTSKECDATDCNNCGFLKNLYEKVNGKKVWAGAKCTY